MTPGGAVRERPLIAGGASMPRRHPWRRGGNGAAQVTARGQPAGAPLRRVRWRRHRAGYPARLRPVSCSRDCLCNVLLAHTNVLMSSSH